MKQTICKRWMIAALLVGVLAGCGGGQESTPVPAATSAAAPAAGAEDTGNVEQSASPLDAPVSPLTQPTSPLVEGEAAAQPAPAQPAGPSITIAVPSDIGVITQLAADTKAPPPQEGMAALGGVLYTPTINRIIPGTQFYLTPAIEDGGEMFIPTMFVGPKEENGDVLGYTNEKGQVSLDSVPPGDYYLAVWKIYDWSLAFGAQNDPLPLLISLEAGDQRDLGLLYVEWP